MKTLKITATLETIRTFGRIFSKSSLAKTYCSVLFGTIGLLILTPCYAGQKNDATHLFREQTPMDFLSESFSALPNNACMQQILRFGYIHSVFLFAVEHRLAEVKNLSTKERMGLMRAVSVLKQGVAPFLSGFPITNSVLATTDLWQEIEEKRRAFSLMR